MGSSDPHVLIVVDDSYETAQFLAVLRFGNVEDGLDFLVNRFDSLLRNPITRMFQFGSGKERLNSIDFQSCLLQSNENLFKLFKMVFERSFCKT